MKETKRLISLLGLFFMLTAMGSIGGEPTGKIPTPQKDFRAVVTDLTGTSTKLREVSFDDGKIFLVGHRGKAIITVDFQHIKQISIKPKGEELIAEVSLQNGEQINLILERQKKIYGRMGIGTFEISIGDVREIKFE
jgi:hypothetical protein